jgi:hypothetical protein
LALTGPGLGSALITKLKAIVNPSNEGELEAFANAVGEAVIEYLLANAIVVGTVSTGAGAGGTVQGTVT